MKDLFHIIIKRVYLRLSFLSVRGSNLPCILPHNSESDLVPTVTICNFYGAHSISWSESGGCNIELILWVTESWIPVVHIENLYSQCCSIIL